MWTGVSVQGQAVDVGPQGAAWCWRSCRWPGPIVHATARRVHGAPSLRRGGARRWIQSTSRWCLRFKWHVSSSWYDMHVSSSSFDEMMLTLPMACILLLIWHACILLLIWRDDAYASTGMYPPPDMTCMYPPPQMTRWCLRFQWWALDIHRELHSSKETYYGGKRDLLTKLN